MGRKLTDPPSTQSGAHLPADDAHVGRFLADAPWLCSRQTKSVLSMLELEGHGARVVGGAVRNALMGHNVVDIDIATTAVPDEILGIATALGFSVHPTGLEHGTVTVVCEHRPYEITTLRKDVAMDGRRATVQFTKDWKEDARRRDFTINALYCDRHGNVYDPIGGYEDVLRKRVRFIGRAEDRIREDYLRILRFFRFYAMYGRDPIDVAGLDACVGERSSLQFLSGERIRSELFRLLAANNALKATTLLVEHDFLNFLFGDHQDVDQLDRLIQIEETLGRDRDPLLRMAALSVRDADDARQIAQKLKLSRSDANRLKRIGALNERENVGDHCADEQGSKAALYTTGLRGYVDCALIRWARSDKATTDPAAIAHVNLPKRWSVPKLPISGSDVVALGVRPGPNVGLAVDRFEDWWINAGFPNDPSLLKDKLKSIVDGL